MISATDSSRLILIAFEGFSMKEERKYRTIVIVYLFLIFLFLIFNKLMIIFI